MNTPQLILHGEFTLSGVISKIVHALENVHIFETSKDWDEETILEDDKEMVNTLQEKEESFQHNKENTEEKSSLEKETFVNEMKEEETFSNEKEVRYLKEKQDNFSKQEQIKTKIESVQLVVF